MSLQAFDVLPYNIESLKQLLAKSPSTPQIIEEKLHAVYFEGYFSELSAKTIVVEEKYVDRDYLEDFSAYYVRCFNLYDRHCTRLHFFSREFKEDDFIRLLAGRPESLSLKDLQDSYLGFIVRKPLPRTLIGRTCLKTYPPDNDRRYFPITRPYEAHLYGLDLTVKTLAFQEQDSVAAACATSALWSAFQGTGVLFHHPIPSPVEITRMASGSPSSTNPDRALPNHGLNLYEMAQAIRGVGLEPSLKGAQNALYLRAAAYAYLRCEIPVLMTIELYDVSKPLASLVGAHAVTIAGYSLGRSQAVAFQSVKLFLKASRIDKFYAHDDQVGPFARMEFDGKNLTIGTPNRDVYSLGTSWRGADGKIGSCRAYPRAILIPLYHKIRIPYETIQSTITVLDNFIHAVKAQFEPNVDFRLEWDIFLTTASSWKREILNTKLMETDIRLESLQKDLPRFLWRAQALYEGKLVLELLFDATDIEQGDVFIWAIEYDKQWAAFLDTVCAQSFDSIFDAFPSMRSMPVRKIIEWFRKQPSPVGDKS